MKPTFRRALLLCFCLVLCFLLLHYDAVDQKYSAASPPNTIQDIWLSGNDFWSLRYSSLVYRGEEKEVDLPTYKAAWHEPTQRLYYVQHRTLYSYDPLTKVSVQLYRLPIEAHFLLGLTQHYALVRQDHVTLPDTPNHYLVELETGALQEISLPSYASYLGYNDDCFFYEVNGGLYRYTCSTGSTTLLFERKDGKRITSLCTTDVQLLFVCRWGDYARQGTLYALDPDSGVVEELPFFNNAVSTAFADGVLLVAGTQWDDQAKTNWLSLYRQIPDGNFAAVPLAKKINITPLVDNCHILLSSGQYIMACRDNLVTGSLN